MLTVFPVASCQDPLLLGLLLRAVIKLKGESVSHKEIVLSLPANSQHENGSLGVNSIKQGNGLKPQFATKITYTPPATAFAILHVSEENPE